MIRALSRLNVQSQLQILPKVLLEPETNNEFRIHSRSCSNQKGLPRKKRSSNRAKEVAQQAGRSCAHCLSPWSTLTSDCLFTVTQKAKVGWKMPSQNMMDPTGLAPQEVRVFSGTRETLGWLPAYQRVGRGFWGRNPVHADGTRTWKLKGHYFSQHFYFWIHIRMGAHLLPDIS